MTQQDNKASPEQMRQLAKALEAAESLANKLTGHSDPEVRAIGELYVKELEQAGKTLDLSEKVGLGAAAVLLPVAEAAAVAPFIISAAVAVAAAGALYHVTKKAWNRYKAHREKQNKQNPQPAGVPAAPLPPFANVLGPAAAAVAAGAGAFAGSAAGSGAGLPWPLLLLGGWFLLSGKK